MSKILAPIKSRIMQFIDFQKIEKKYFFEKIQVAPSNFRSEGLKSEVGGDVIAKILALFPNMNAEWLLTGKGEMLKKVKEYAGDFLPANEVSEAMPVYGGHGTSTNSYPDEVAPDDRKYIIVSGFNAKEHRAFEITGNSMSPLADERDIVLGKQLFEVREITDGEVYMLKHQTDGYMLKRLYLEKRDDDFFIHAQCDNANYTGTIIHAADILEFWHIKAVLKFNMKPIASEMFRLIKLEKELQTLRKKLAK
jgi:hypothetical protein